MSVIFKAQNHQYQSLDPSENIQWTSVTSFVANFKPKFDVDVQAIKSSKNRKSKWFGLDPETIKNYWKKEADRAVSVGSTYHDQREGDLLSLETIERSGRAIPIIKPIVVGDVKHAPSQRLVEGVYPEHFVYLKSAGICGQSDRVEVIRDTVDIVDYKTNKEIKTEGFKRWDGTVEMMDGPCSHLENTNFNHYALQLSTYMYIILRHNPSLKPGKLTLHHIIFEKTGDDKFGYPILAFDHLGNPKVKDVVPYEVPYLKNEVISMINWLKDNKQDAA